MATPDPKILDSFRNRLLGSINRSHLMRVSISKTGRLLDLRRLEKLHEGLGKQVLEAVIGDEGANIDFSWRFGPENASLFNLEGADHHQGEHKPTEEKLIEAMFTRIIREGALAKRETGIQTIWLGYPLLHVLLGDAESPKQLLAPVFLWPISIDPDQRRPGRYCVRRDGLPRFNRAMAVWIRNNLGINMDVPSEDELADLSWETLPNHLSRLAQGLDLEIPDRHRGLDPVPLVKTMQSQRAPKFIHSAVMGYFRWQNERLLADIEAIKDIAGCQAPVSGYISGEPLDRSNDKTSPPAEEDQFLVYDADFSQEHAVWNSRGGKGLVIHGPPGTGKSQTIVNVIADALAHDRTVLMVCQKQAATRVVLERLRKVGLADLCMEVHDADKERIAVFNKIREQVQNLPNEAPRRKTQEQRQRLAHEITALKKELDGIAKGIHEKQPGVGLSFGEIKAREGRIMRFFQDARVIPSLEGVLRNISCETLDEICKRAQEVGRWFKEADPFNNPWRDHQPNLHDDPGTTADIEGILTKLMEQDGQHQEQIESSGVGDPLPLELVGYREAIGEFVAKIRELEENPESVHSKLSHRWLMQIRKMKSNELQICRQRCAAAIDFATRITKLRLDAAWDNKCADSTNEDLERLRQHVKCISENHDRWWWWRWRNGYSTAAKAIRSQLVEPSSSTTIDLADGLRIYLEIRNQQGKLARMNQDLLPGAKPGAANAAHQVSYPQKVGKALEAAAWLADQERKYDFLSPLLDKFLKQEKLSADLERVQQSLKRAHCVSRLLETLTRLEAFLTPEALAPVRHNILAGKSIRNWLHVLTGTFKKIPALLRWEIDCKRRQPLDKAIFQALETYEHARSGGQTLPWPPSRLPDEQYGTWWSALIEFTAVKTWLALCHEKHPELLQFNPEQHDLKRSQLRDSLREKRGLEAQRICEIWLAKQVQVRGEPWPQIFQQRGAKAKRLRQAVELSLPRGLLKLRPCWLMDPETAAQVFPLQPGLFDVVIFDEASQCPVECAVPAIFRGKTLIVSGDGMQLPPTSFFSTRINADGDEDDDDAESSEKGSSINDSQTREVNSDFLRTVEDLLDASIGNLPECQLLVHYRSDHPALIEFSNRAFYRGKLEAPPARMDASSSKPPIEYCHVNSVYEDRTNREEAVRIVRILKGTWQSEGESATIGVVTFNRPQRDLIEDLLERECQRDVAFAARYQQELVRKVDNQDVGFFVKNLENVQGDERDMMIFSTTFGPNRTGAFHRRFGPVGADRGERRLNVAVTRAKKRIVIVSSMPIDEISEALSTASAPGTSLKPRCYLQLYLAYAQAVSVGDREQVKRVLDRLSQPGDRPPPPPSPVDSPLEQEVFDALLKLGHEVDCQVGASGFLIDLAVRHPNRNLGYVLGIECDGATYHSDRAAHLRDVWRESILRRRGWKIYRVWSTNWWYRRGEEIAKLQDAIAGALAQVFEPQSTDLAGIADSAPIGLPPESASSILPDLSVVAPSANSNPDRQSSTNVSSISNRSRVKKMFVRTDKVVGTEVRFDPNSPPSVSDCAVLEAAGFRCKGALWAWVATFDEAEAKARLKAAGFVL